MADVVGTHRCQDCGRIVELRRNKNAKVYYHCDGSADVSGAGCGSRHTSGAAYSRKTLADLAAASRTPANEGTAAHEPHPEPEAPAAERAPAGDAAAGTRPGRRAGLVRRAG